MVHASIHVYHKNKSLSVLCGLNHLCAFFTVSGKKDKDKDQDPGIIMYDVNGTKQTIPFSISVILGAPPNNSDKVLYMCISSVATSSMS